MANCFQLCSFIFRILKCFEVYLGIKSSKTSPNSQGLVKYLCTECIVLNYEIFNVVLAEVRHSIDVIFFLGTFLQQNAKDLEVSLKSRNK